MRIYPITDHYYQPLFVDSRLKNSLRDKRNLPGLDFRIDSQISFLDNLTYTDELLDLQLNKPPINNLDFFLGNGSFESGDAEFLYQILRFLKPRNLIEIGSGHSTRIAHQALRRNFLESKSDNCTHLCIEPFEMPWLEQLDVIVMRNMIEDCDLSLFDSLERNDILFIDSSHMIRPQGDVLTEYLEILPRLHSGVIVHVHDIFSPRDYLDEWIRDDVRFWNEQYLLETLLSNTSRYEVIASLNYLACDYYSHLIKVCPYLLPGRQPGSFYFRVK
ncbi:methyltransferase domain protein [Synechococcus sp. A18-40]|nr:methyltransferase domain protein [Synechococcus sp. A18-40]